MYNFNMQGTKWKIFEKSVELFAKRGYDSVSMRDIAKEVDIRASSIYNHFQSKEEILTTIYDYYNYYFIRFTPTLEELLEDVETKHPKEVLLRMAGGIPDQEVDELMNKMFLIASSKMYDDLLAEELILRNMFDAPEEYLRAVLTKMVDLKKIKPLNIDAYILLHCSFCHSTTLLMQTSHSISKETWLASYRFLIDSIIEITEDAEGVA